MSLQETFRPLVFIGHSLGGLVIKKVLLPGRATSVDSPD